MADDNRAQTYSEMRNQSLFTDAVVKSSSGREWNVHKVVMSRAGKYFCTAFTFPWFNGTLDLAVSDAVVQVIIDLAYEGASKVVVDGDNVMEVLSAAFMYQLEDLIQICVTFVMDNMISFEHILDLKVFLRNYQVVFETFTNGALREIVDTFIRRNFIDLCEGDDMNNLSVGELEDYFKEDDLDIGEADLLQFVLKYIRFHKLSTERASQLLANVRLELIDSTKISQVAGDENLSLFPQIEIRRIENASYLCIRYPRDIVVSIGRIWETDTIRETDTVEIFNVRKNEWKVTEMNDIFPDVILGNIFYEIKFPHGGWTRVKSLDIKSGHLGTEKLSQLPFVPDREYREVVSWNGGIILFTRHNNAAQYNPDANEWTYFPAKMGIRKELLEGTEDSFIIYRRNKVVVDGNLLSIGACDGDENSTVKSIEYFDTERMCWVLCGDLKKNPDKLQMEVVGGKVYLFTMSENYAECFQPIWEGGRLRIDWLPNIQLPWTYQDVKISVLDNKILFTGVFQVDKNEEDYGLKEANLFCPKTGKWSRLSDLNGRKISPKVFTINTSELDIDRIEQICNGELVEEIADSDDE